MRLFLTGGFLGSGKTTAIKNACTELMNTGVKVAVITNDQGGELVDTGYIKHFGIPATEVPNGCFCCNYNQLAQALSSLYDTEQPEVIFAESVGSCTDLIATVAKPLEKFYPPIKIVISVLADASLLYNLISCNSSFLNEEVQYIYKKQLAEADILILNKIDLLEKEEIQIVQKIIQEDYPDKTILYQNTLLRQDVQKWLLTMHNFRFPNPRPSLDLDYAIYAKGEALLAWLDEELDICATKGTAYNIAMELINRIHTNIRKQQFLIGHLKFLIDNGQTRQKVSYTAIYKVQKEKWVNLPEANKVSLLINARVQAAPTQLKAIITDTIEEIAAQTGSQIFSKKQSCFQPGYPKPIYRIRD